jgi:hypothetical protein
MGDPQRESLKASRLKTEKRVGRMQTYGPNYFKCGTPQNPDDKLFEPQCIAFNACMNKRVSTTIDDEYDAADFCLNQFLTIKSGGAAPAANPQGPLRPSRIVSAEYGFEGRRVDVKRRVWELSRGGKAAFMVSNEALGGDPAPDRVKALVLRVRGQDGRATDLAVSEHEEVKAGIGDIITARYGVKAVWVDVTPRVRQMTEDGSDPDGFFVDGIGVDPAPHDIKTLRLRTRGADGTIGSAEYQDDQYVLFRPKERGDGAYSELQVVQASYGPGPKAIDVARRLQDQVVRDRLDIKVSNGSMGADPAPNERKSLTIRYRFKGKLDEATINEGQRLRLP